LYALQWSFLIFPEERLRKETTIEVVITQAHRLSQMSLVNNLGKELLPRI